MKRIGSFIAGLLVGTMLFGGSVAYAAGVVAELSSHRFFVDGQEVKMTAYAINGNNYVMLRDIGKAVGFNVHWDSTNGCVQIESDKPYTGTAPAKTQSVAVGAKKADYTQADVMPEPKAGDKIPVDYCERRFVKKPPRAKAGFVTYTDFKTVLVTPDRHEKEEG